MSAEILNQINPEENAVMEDAVTKEQEYILDHILKQKIGQIIGMSIPYSCNVDELKEMLKTNGQTEALAEVEKAISDVKNVKDEESYLQFFSKDLRSQMPKIHNLQTNVYYAIDQQSPEMNQVERIYRDRDQRIERGELNSIIFTEEKHKQHLKEGTFPPERIQTQMMQTLVTSPARYQSTEGPNQHSTTKHKGGKSKPPLIGDGPAGEVVINHPRDQTKVFCLCARQNDNKQYIECEGQCEWYHPECVGFDAELIKKNQNNMLFLCPMCN